MYMWEEKYTWVLHRPEESDLLDQYLQAIWRHPVLVLGTNLGTSVKVVYDFNC